MKFDPIECQIKGYITKGTEILSTQTLNVSVPRHARDNYIGMSSITKCGRYLWVSYFHNNLLPKDPITVRTSRIFDLGHICEDIILQSLTLGGASVTGTQSGFSDFNGVVRGHCDCVVDSTLIGEIKSMNEASFEKFLAMDLRTTHWAYYVQVQLYEFYSKLFDGVLIAVNKNTSAVECQRIPFNQEIVDFHRAKAEAIINAKSFFDINQPYTVEHVDECKFCPLKSICYGQ